jgi:hypothetical protein
MKTLKGPWPKWKIDDPRRSQWRTNPKFLRIRELARDKKLLSQVVQGIRKQLTEAARPGRAAARKDKQRDCSREYFRRRMEQVSDQRRFATVCRRIDRRGLVGAAPDREVDRQNFLRACRRVRPLILREDLAVQRKLKRLLRRRMGKVLKGLRSAGSVEDLVGCTLAQLRGHLESKFQPGMTWHNRGFRGWHIDHIRPCASFDLADPEQQRKCFYYNNLQPLWAADNMRKGAKV